MSHTWCNIQAAVLLLVFVLASLPCIWGAVLIPFDAVFYLLMDAIGAVACLLILAMVNGPFATSRGAQNGALICGVIAAFVVAARSVTQLLRVVPLLCGTSENRDAQSSAAALAVPMSALAVDVREDGDVVASGDPFSDDSHSPPPPHSPRQSSWTPWGAKETQPKTREEAEMLLDSLLG
jgi:hypothetical protein